MVRVVLREGETVDSLIRRFNKAVESENIIEDYKNKMYYIKPSKIAQERKKGHKKR
jgi:ribosomal protein S21